MRSAGQQPESPLTTIWRSLPRTVLLKPSAPCQTPLPCQFHYGSVYPAGDTPGTQKVLGSRRLAAGLDAVKGLILH